MALEPKLEEQELLADTLRRARSSMTSRERAVEGSVAAAFVFVVGCLWALDPPGAFAVLPAAGCLVVLALATRVRFDMPFGFTVPTQLAFVPLLFAMPLALVPVGVVGALLLASLRDVLAGRSQPGRLLLMVGNSWFAIGPVAVFALAGTVPGQAGAGLLIGALMAQFVADAAASTVRFAVGRGAALLEQLGEAWVYAIDIGLSVVGLAFASEIPSHPAVVLAPLPLLAIFAVLARERHQRLEALLELNSAYRGTALVLGDVVEADDGYTGIHCKSVVALALSVGEELRLDAEQRRNLEFAALLHDVGKIAIPKEIINKPGKLTAHEWTLIKTHTIEGQKMLDRIGGFMREVGLIVRSHHERWDGGGYPDGLAGEEIPLEARIITCCDSWNAMRTDRSYRKALPPETALGELEVNAGGQFDPRVVEIMLRTLSAPEHRIEPDPEAEIEARSLTPVGGG
jgi:putative nucleotidyltransferase with HDIG domain